MSRCSAIVAALVALALPLGQAYAQSDEDKAAARSLAKQGAESFIAGKHAEALDLMSRAEALVHAPTHVLYIARSQAALGKLVASRESYLKVIREDLAANAPKAFKDAQEQAKTEIATVEPKIASIRIVVEGAGRAKVNVKLDGQPVSPALIGVHRPIDPGKHVVIAYPLGLSPVEQMVELTDGEKKDVKLTITSSGATLSSGLPLNAADDPDAGTRTSTPTEPDKKSGGVSGLAIAGIGVGVVGIAGVVVGSIFVVKRGSLTTEADDKYTQYGCPACSQTRQDEINDLDSKAASAGTIGTIGLVAGGALLLGGGTMAVLGFMGGKKTEPTKPTSAWITPWISPTGAGLTGRF